MRASDLPIVSLDGRVIDGEMKKKKLKLSAARITPILYGFMAMETLKKVPTLQWNLSKEFL